MVTKKTVSEAQRKANRENAKRSTGPRTARGKQTVSGNRLKSGIYSQVLRPVWYGPMREDADEFATFVEALRAALDPQDAIEAAHADQIVALHVRLTRINRLEDRMVDGANVRTHLALDGHKREDRGRLENQLHALQGLLLICHEPQTQLSGEPDYEVLLVALDELGPATAGSFPDSGRKAKDVFWEFADRTWPERDGLVQWALGALRHLVLVTRMYEGEEVLALGQSLGGQALETTTRLYVRLSRELERHLALYAALQSRHAKDGRECES